MRRSGADCSVVVMKRGNARGAKGAGHRRWERANWQQDELQFSTEGGSLNSVIRITEMVIADGQIGDQDHRNAQTRHRRIDRRARDTRVTEAWTNRTSTPSLIRAYPAPRRSMCGWIASPSPEFLAAKALLATRPVFHRTDAAIRGHLFCTFLALVLRRELLDRLAARGGDVPEWRCIIDDLLDLSAVEVEQNGRRALLRTAPRPSIRPDLPRTRRHPPAGISGGADRQGKYSHGLTVWCLKI